MQPPLKLLENPPESQPTINTAQGGIVVATDFSAASAEAVDIAAHLARQVQAPLVLVHAANPEPRESLPGEIRDSLALYARAQYHDEMERLAALPVSVTEAFRAGAPEQVLLEEASRFEAQLLVLASTHHQHIHRWLHGSVAERVAESAHIPTLLVRNGKPLSRWLQDGRRLRVLVGADLTAPSEAALRWIQWLRKIGPCDVVVGFVERNPLSYPTPDYHPSLMDDVIADTLREQERAFRRRVRMLLGRKNVRVRYETGWGSSDAHLIHLALEERADLIVVGTHSRHGTSRLLHHSVSRGVLHYAATNVACIPIAERPFPFRD
jgi:nucleotide-binding universal stress UspA family protein